MRISEIYKVNASQHELDFVDIDIDIDTPLFLDPYFIAKNSFPIALEAHNSLRTFFQCLLEKLKNMQLAAARELFSHLGESNELCLGFSSKKPRGKGIGPSDAEKIFRSLKDSPALKSGLMEDIEDIRIFVDKVDKDKTSDMTANIIKKQLIDYTREQCKIWGIRMTPDVPSGFYWDSEKLSWENEYTEMLVFEGQKILLVPKRLVSFSKEYTPQKYLQHFVLNFLQNEQLRLNGPLVQFRKDNTPYVTKKSLKASDKNLNSVNKEWLADFTKRHPKVFKDFREKTYEKIHPISNNVIAQDSESIESVCGILIAKLKKTPKGAKGATDYHRAIFGILELLFYPNLCNPEIEKEIHEGRKRIDILFDNCAESGFFSRTSSTLNVPSQFIMVECKNYSKKVSNPELDQISGRFSPDRGKLGIITFRDVDDMDLLIKRCNDTYKDERGLIIPLGDEDLIKMLKFKAKEDDIAIEKFLQKCFRRVALGK